MDPKIKAGIDALSYSGLLSLWRLSPVGHPFFQGEAGDYFKKVMTEKRDALPPGEAVAVSKRIGWG